MLTLTIIHLKQLVDKLAVLIHPETSHLRKTDLPSLPVICPILYSPMHTTSHIIVSNVYVYCLLCSDKTRKMSAVPHPNSHGEMHEASR